MDLICSCSLGGARLMRLLMVLGHWFFYLFSFGVGYVGLLSFLYLIACYCTLLSDFALLSCFFFFLYIYAIQNNNNDRLTP